MVTIKDIASMANVSRGTVDRVLNNRGGVSAKTEERVRMIAEKLNYSPSLAGKELAAIKKGLKFGFILPTDLSNHSSVSRAVIRKTSELAEYGVTVVPRYVMRENLNDLLCAMDDLREEGISGIALSPMDSELLTRKVQELADAGIPVVTYEYDLPGSSRLACIGCDYYRNGQTIAGIVRLLLRSGGNVGIISGDMSARVHAQRIRGIEDHLQESGRAIHVVEKRVCFEDDISTYTTLKSMLEEHPEIDLVVLNVVSSYGGMRAIKESSKPLRVISTNRISQMEQYLFDGSADAVITHQPWLLADMSLDVLFRCLVWGLKPHFETFYTNDEVIIAENAYSKKLELLAYQNDSHQKRGVLR